MSKSRTDQGRMSFIRMAAYSLLINLGDLKLSQNAFMKELNAIFDDVAPGSMNRIIKTAKAYITGDQVAPFPPEQYTLDEIIQQGGISSHYKTMIEQHPSSLRNLLDSPFILVFFNHHFSKRAWTIKNPASDNYLVYNVKRETKCDKETLRNLIITLIPKEGKIFKTRITKAVKDVYPRIGKDAVNLVLTELGIDGTLEKIRSS